LTENRLDKGDFLVGVGIRWYSENFCSRYCRISQYSKEKPSTTWSEM